MPRGTFQVPRGTFQVPRGCVIIKIILIVSKVHCCCASKANLRSSQTASPIKSDSLLPKYPTVHCDPANGWQAVAPTSAPTPSLDQDLLTTLSNDPTQARSPCDAGCQECQDLINVYTYASSLDITRTSSRKQKQLDRNTMLTKSHTYTSRAHLPRAPS